MLLSESYRLLNSQLHSSDPMFGAHGHVIAPGIAGLAMKLRADSVLDYGCGKGTFKPALLAILPTIEVREYDPAIAEKASAPSPADIVVCADVMEHIEPDCLEDVIRHLRSLTRKLLVAGIAVHPAEKLLADGRNAHLIVQNKEWWLARFAVHFRDVKTQDNDGGFLGLFTP